LKREREERWIRDGCGQPSGYKGGDEAADPNSQASNPPWAETACSVAMGAVCIRSQGKMCFRAGLADCQECRTWQGEDGSCGYPAPCVSSCTDLRQGDMKAAAAFEE
jgi:hypothetical protein